MQETIFDLLNNTVELPDYLEGEGFQESHGMKKAGSEYAMVCPFHEDSNPSLQVYWDSNSSPEKWVWHCKGCGRGGDLIDFHKERYKLTTNQAIEALADRFNIDKKQWQIKPQAQTTFSARKIANQYFMRCLEQNKEAQEYLENRGVTRELQIKYQLGYSDGRSYEYLKSVIKMDDNSPNTQLLVDIGVATLLGKGTGVRIKGSIGPGKITFPVTYNGKIAFWHLRSASKDKSAEYQIRNEGREKVDGKPDEFYALFYNQDDTKQREFFVVEGPYDVIALKEAGYNVIGLMGKGKKSQIEFLQNLTELNPRHDELTKKKKINIMFDRDANGEGQRASERLETELHEHHIVMVYDLPEGQDIDDYLREGKSVENIRKRKPISDKMFPVIASDNMYWMKGGSNGATKPISNFIIDRKYVHVSSNGSRTYKVQIHTKNGSTGLLDWNPKDFASLRPFREWLANRGDYYFEGNEQDLQQVIKYIYHTSEPNVVHLRDSYGHCEKGIWLFENGAIKNGEVIWEDDQGIIPIGTKRIPNIRSTLAGMANFKAKIPETWYSPKEIVQNMLKFYNGRIGWVWKSLGFATAMYYHNIIRGMYREFPSMALYGETMTGKTSLGVIIGSLLGSGILSNPSAQSTSKGLERLMALMNSLPIVVNEYHTKGLGPLVRDVYDCNQNLRAVKTGDNQIHRSAINTALILTSEHIPSESSVQNRLLMMDFTHVEKTEDVGTIVDFEQFKSKGVTLNQNIGWLIALSGAGGEDTILDDINYSQAMFLEFMPEADSRVVLNYAICFGAFKNACRVLKIGSILEELGEDPINKEDLFNEFIFGSQKVKNLNKESSPLYAFFNIMDRLYMDGRLDKFVKKEWTTEQTIKFNLKSVWQLVFEADNRGEKILAKLTCADIRSAMKRHLDIDTKCSIAKANGERGSERAYRVGLNELEAKFQVHFEGIDDQEEE
jgi:DNA primase catalytic core